MKKQCKHKEFLDKINEAIESNKDYWMMTEFFVYLHGGKDYCNCHEESEISTFNKELIGKIKEIRAIECQTQRVINSLDDLINFIENA